MRREIGKTAPICRRERGYDTHVKICPNAVYTDDAQEQSRTVTVTCTTHDITAQAHFRTATLCGREIMVTQDEAFEKCFTHVERRCHAAIAAESEALMHRTEREVLIRIVELASTPYTPTPAERDAEIRANAQYRRELAAKRPHEKYWVCLRQAMYALQGALDRHRLRREALQHPNYRPELHNDVLDQPEDIDHEKARARRWLARAIEIRRAGNG